MRQRCQACGVLGRSSAKFCQSCGAELAAEPEQPPSGLVGLPCPACGADTRAGAQFCTACGASLSSAQHRGGLPSGGPEPDQPVGKVPPSRMGRGRQRSRMGLWIGGGAAVVVAITAGIALALMLLVGDDEDGNGVAGELEIVLQIIPRAVLLGQDQTTETLTLLALDSNGDEIPIDTLAIEWMSGDSDIVSIVPDPVNAATATVTVLNSIGTAMITARLRTNHNVVAPSGGCYPGSAPSGG